MEVVIHYMIRIDSALFSRRETGAISSAIPQCGSQTGITRNMYTIPPAVVSSVGGGEMGMQHKPPRSRKWISLPPPQLFSNSNSNHIIQILLHLPSYPFITIIINRLKLLSSCFIRQHDHIKSFFFNSNFFLKRHKCFHSLIWQLKHLLTPCNQYSHITQGKVAFILLCTE